MKLIFGLNGSTEHSISSYCENYNNTQDFRGVTLFVWSEWVRFIEAERSKLRCWRVSTAIKSGMSTNTSSGLYTDQYLLGFSKFNSTEFPPLQQRFPHSSLAFFFNLSSVEETLTNAKLTLKMKVNPRPAYEIATIETPFLTTTKQAAACSMELDHYKYKAVELPVSNEEDEGTSVLFRPSSSLSIDKWNNFKKAPSRLSLGFACDF